MLMNRQPTNYGANISWLVTECSQLFNESLLRNDVDFFFVWKMRPLSSTIQCKHNFNFHSVRVLHLHQYRRKVVLIEFSNIWKISEMINEQKKTFLCGSVCPILIVVRFACFWFLLFCFSSKTNCDSGWEKKDLHLFSLRYFLRRYQPKNGLHIIEKFFKKDTK